MQFRLKKILAVLDALPVMIMAFMSWRSNDGLLPPVLITAVLMFCWHFIENALLRSKFDQEKQTGYVGYMEWPNIIFTFMIVIAFSERRMLNGIPVMSPEMALTGCLVTIAGITLRVWAYVTLKEEFSKAPGMNKKYIRSGLYRFIDHPANIGFFLIGMGVAAGLASLGGCLAGVTLLLPSLVFVSRFEKKLLRTTMA
jgi:protein-S-isoprenylcysteine O-methyltransferase Ste14